MEPPLPRLLHRARQVPPALLGDGAWVLGVRLLTGASAFVIQVLLARLLAPADLGGYFLAVSVSLPLAAAGQLGLGAVALRAVAAALARQAPDQAADVTMGALRAAALGALGVLAAACLSGPLVQIPLGLSALCGLWAALLIGQGLLAELLRGFGRPRTAALLGGAIGNLAALTPLAALWLGGATLQLPHVIALLALGAGLALAVGGVSLRHALGRQQAAAGAAGGLPAPTPSSAAHPWALLRQAWPLLLNQLLLLAMARLDLWIVGLWGPPALVAGYAIALRLALFVAMPLEIGRAAIAGRIAALHAQGRLDQLERLLRATATLMLLGALPIALAWAVAGAPLIGLIYGPAYTVAAPLLVILSLGQLANVATGLCGQTLILSGHGALVLRVNLLASLAALALMPAFGATWGLIGVAAAAALGVTLRTTALLLSARRMVGVWTCVGKIRVKYRR